MSGPRGRDVAGRINRLEFGRLRLIVLLVRCQTPAEGTANTMGCLEHQSAVVTAADEYLKAAKRLLPYLYRSKQTMVADTRTLARAGVVAYRMSYAGLSDLIGYAVAAAVAAREEIAAAEDLDPAVAKGLLDREHAKVADRALIAQYRLLTAAKVLEETWDETFKNWNHLFGIIAHNQVGLESC